MKIQKEKKFKSEYIPIVIGVIILILFIALLVVTIAYEGNIEKEDVSSETYGENKDILVDNSDSKCSTSDLKEITSIANKVSAEYDYKYLIEDIPEEEKANYSEEELEDYFPTGQWTVIRKEITVNDIGDNIQIVITNDKDDKEIKITSKDTEDGKYSFYDEYLYEKVTYYVSIYSNTDDCQEELVRKTSFETLIYNYWYGTLSCLTYSGYENCSKVVEEEIEPDEFLTKLEEYKNLNKEETEKAEEQAMQAMYVRQDVEEIRKQEEEEESSNDNSRMKLIIISAIIISIGILIIILLMFLRRKRL